MGHLVGHAPKSTAGEPNKRAVTQSVVPGVEGIQNAEHTQTIVVGTRKEKEVRDGEGGKRRTEGPADSRTGEVMLQRIQGDRDPAKTAGGPALHPSGSKPAIK
jgi:hypothetical protein